MCDCDCADCNDYCAEHDCLYTCPKCEHERLRARITQLENDLKWWHLMAWPLNYYTQLPKHQTVMHAEIDKAVA